MERELEKELNKLKKKIADFEKKFLFISNYKVVATILDKFSIEYLELSYEEIENSNNRYIAEYDHKNKKVIVKKINFTK